MALHNLVANAIQYSPDDFRVGIGVTNTDGIVEIAVTDQGVGIPEDEKDRVFERFFRVDPPDPATPAAPGLGLSIVKHAVQNHGGEVRVWSQPGSGSTFTIRLPEASNAGTHPQARNRLRRHVVDAAHHPRSTDVTRILIVEDEPSLSEPLAFLLAREGYDTEIAPTAATRSPSSTATAPTSCCST